MGETFTIDFLGSKGDGVCYSGSRPVYIDRTIPGEKVKARMTRGAGIQRAELIEILRPSQFRQKAPCSHYEKCGGCSLQHLTSQYYQQAKLELVRQVFSQNGLRPRQWLAPIFVGEKQRRRVTLTAGKQGKQLRIGYYRRRSQQLSDIDLCLVATPEVFLLRNRLRPLLERILSSGQWVDIFIQCVGGDVDVVFTGAFPAPRESLIKDWAIETGVSRVCWRVDEKDKPQVLYPGKVQALFGSLKVELPPAAFLQPTLDGEKALVSAVLRAIPEQGRFADLFSGCGTFSGPLLSLGEIDAFESVPSHVRALTTAARGHALRAFRRDLFRNPLRPEELNRYDAIVMDPPREGCEEQAIALARTKARLLISVSCNPATFARDARWLRQGGFFLDTVQIVDQFLWSHHVELVGVFTKGKRK